MIATLEGECKLRENPIEPINPSVKVTITTCVGGRDEPELVHVSEVADYTDDGAVAPSGIPTKTVYLMHPNRVNFRTGSRRLGQVYSSITINMRTWEVEDIALTHTVDELQYDCVNYGYPGTVEGMAQAP